ncbi:MAG: DUF4184 family protein [Bacteroidetes bacterium]|nr:DUF4184 family protein [Bacteroidota bacterium]MBS1930009.1 DUF4184 family protein [Bacteroidota bacterium]
MPFTFSHPGAVLPLGYLPKRYFSMTALVVGSIAPDFEYFIRMDSYSSFSHSLKGMFWFDLPLTIILAFVFHGVVRNKLIDNLPAFVASKFQVFKDFAWPAYFNKKFITVIYSAIIGISSHILWDAFTHERGIFSSDIGVLKEMYAISVSHRFATYNLLQLISSITGILIVFYAIFQLHSDKRYVQKSRIFPFWLIVITVMLIVFVIRFLNGLKHGEYRAVVMTIISGGLIGILLASIFLPAKENVKQV